MLGVSTNRLLALLDNHEYGASHPETKRCFELTMQLLDAAKSDIDVVYSRDLYKVPIPHYMKKANSEGRARGKKRDAEEEEEVYHSISVLGSMYDRVHQHEREVDGHNRLILPKELAAIPQCKCGEKCQIYYKEERRAWKCNKKPPDGYVINAILY
jgi:hypothetical protein